MVGLLENNKDKVNISDKMEQVVVEEIKLDNTTDNNKCNLINNVNENSFSDDEIILENVKNLLKDVLNLISDCDAEGNETENTTLNEEEDSEDEIIHKGILKHERTYSNKHVDFDLALKYIPFDPKKDFTIDIQFVETIPKKVVSYAALFAQKKAEEEEKQKAAAIEVECAEENALAEKIINNSNQMEINSQ